MGTRTVAAGERGGVAATVRLSEMPADMAAEALRAADEALRRELAEKDMAAHIKHHFDSKFGPTWHVIVGRNFGSWFSHENHRFCWLYAGKYGVLIFKSA